MFLIGRKVLLVLTTAFAMHGIQVSWKADSAICLNLGSFKEGAI